MRLGNCHKSFRYSSVQFLVVDSLLEKQVLSD